MLESHAQGRNNVLVIDEAQNLAPDVLEQLRLLTNLETSERKLLQIILIGQPELRTMLARPELEQLAQRVIARYHLGPLSEAETGAYIAHRMAVAGLQGAPVFPAAIVPLVHRITGRRAAPHQPAVRPRAARRLCREQPRSHAHSSCTKRPRKCSRAKGRPPARSARWPLVAGGVLAGAALSAAAAWQVLPHRVPLVRSKPAVVEGRAPPAPAAGVPRGVADEAAALRALATLWGAALPAGDACQVALRADLRCHAGRGGMYELRQLDRPAVITLRDGRSTSYAVLEHMDERSVTLLANGKRERVELAALVPRFSGEYTTFWKMPRAFRDHLAPGDQGVDVDWLATRLAKAGRVAAPAAPQPFDARTQELLRSFQARQNLKADGVAGPRTYMRLNQLTGVAEPRLLAAAGTGH